MRKPLDLSADLVATVHRDIPEPPPDPDRTPMSDDDYAKAEDEIATALGSQPLLVFGYGSLLWKPGFDFAARWPARAFGWHRSFCMIINRWRGSIDQPGLMMALEHGGVCQGVVFRVETGDERRQIGKLLRREIPYRRTKPGFRWISVRDHEGPKRALTFYAGMKGDRYFVQVSIDEQAYKLARAAGHGGTGAAYLQETVAHLEALGIHDEYLWRLQKLVAAEIRSLKPPGAADAP
jgi:cation transport protein ChaC